MNAVARTNTAQYENHSGALVKPETENFEDDAEQRTPTGAFQTMDLLRAVVAAAVAISHIRDLFVMDYAGERGVGRIFYFLTGFGHAGVVMFFVLSGFWITKTVVRRAGMPHFWRVYLVDRLTRLWIVIIPALVLGGILDFIGSRLLHAPVYDGHSGAYSLVDRISLAPHVFVTNVLFLQNIIGPVFGSNGPLWSLAYEFWFYLWFPALWFLIRYRKATLALFSLGILFLAPSLLIGFLSWACGAFLYGATRRWGGEAQSATSMRTGLILGSAISILGLVSIRLYSPTWMYPVLAIAFSIFLFAVYKADLKIPGVGAISRFGAKSSFSLYAIHYPVAALAAALIVPNGRLQYSFGAILMVVIVLGMSIVLAMLFASCTEAKTGYVRRRFGAPQRLAV